MKPLIPTYYIMNVLSRNFVEKDVCNMHAAAQEHEAQITASAENRCHPSTKYSTGRARWGYRIVPPQRVDARYWDKKHEFNVQDRVAS
jgi:hypothetical protein